MPPRATGPPRRCTPSICAEQTKISNAGRGWGAPAMRRGSILSDRYAFAEPSVSAWKKLVRSVLSIRLRKLRRMRSWSRLWTCSSRVSNCCTSAASAVSRSPRAGSNRASNRASRTRTTAGLALSAAQMYGWV